MRDFNSLTVVEIDLETTEKCKCGKGYRYFKIIQHEGAIKGVLRCDACKTGDIVFTVAGTDYCKLCDKEYSETELINGYCPVCMGGRNPEKVRVGDYKCV